MTYPPTQLYSHNNIHKILQIADLHLFSDIHAEVLGKNCQKSFEQCLHQALLEDDCDLILLTGDLVSEPNVAIYNRIFDILSDTKVAFACIAGNHDVTNEVGLHLPFEQREFLPCSPDSRLLHRYVIEGEDWQVILLDSTIAGKVAGRLDFDDLHWLKHQLTINSKYALIALHHHVTPMNSYWIDQHILQNADEFWSTITPFSHVKAVINGHAHQEHEYSQNGIVAYTTPSACYQFKPNQDTFCYDLSVTSGYRWLYLHSDGMVQTKVSRLS